MQVTETDCTGKLEDSLHEASVVFLFKKGDSSKLEMFRAISLLITHILQTTSSNDQKSISRRIGQLLIENAVWFQKRTIFLARRLQSQKFQVNLSIVLLDWETLEIPTSTISPVISMPNIKDKLGWRHLRLFHTTGIRQGCAFSPYLFTLIMSVIKCLQV